MASIESSGWPLVFKVSDDAEIRAPDLTYSTVVRALEGMQKEAIIASSESSTWRMVSDEGPYLHGTDLAPFPLAFFTAGMQFSFMSSFLEAARQRDLPIDALGLEQDNGYSMEGSFLRGDAKGGAMPAALHLKIESRAPADEIAGAVHAAEANSPAQSLMREALANTFALEQNGEPINLQSLPPSPASESSDAEPTFAARFEALEPADPSGYRDGIIRKTRAAETVHGVEGGAGSSLQAEQKRTLHVHGDAQLVGDGLMESTIELIKPIGSTFRFLCDETRTRQGNESAPPPLAYLCAGIGFCYMTQLSRFAHIIKQPLRSYGIVQRNAFTLEPTGEATGASAHPVDTRVVLEADRSTDEARDLVATGERTCFLHASMRGAYRSRISAELNGAMLPLS